MVEVYPYLCTFGQTCNRCTGFVAMATYAPSAKCQRGRLYSLYGWFQMATSWRYYRVLMLSAFSCGLVFAPDASADKNARPAADNVAHIDALQGKCRAHTDQLSLSNNSRRLDPSPWKLPMLILLPTALMRQVMQSPASVRSVRLLPYSIFGTD